MTPCLAVVLAAGRGGRLGPISQKVPKGLLRIGERTLIERSLEALRGAGIERVIIVTGHLASQYEDLASRLGTWISIVHNRDFASSGSLVSLTAAGPLREPYLLVESDLLYEPRAPRLLVEAAQSELLLASGFTYSGDEVYVGARNGHLVDLTKRAEALKGDRVGELVGLTRISPEFQAEILREADVLLARERRTDYEAALVRAAHRHELPVLVVEDLIWTEVDDARDFARARNIVLPRIEALD
jgi:choline kinase